MSARLPILLFLLACPSFVACSGAAWLPDEPRRVVRGPLPARTQHPLGLTMLAFRPRRAATQASGEWGYDVLSVYTSIEEVRTSGNDSARFDGELWRTTFRATRGLTDKLDVEFEIPVLYTSSGFLDSFIEHFHQAFGLPDGGRNRVPDNGYDMVLASDSNQLYTLDQDRVGLQDVPIFLALQLCDEGRDGLGVAGRVGLELPVGSQDKGFGNGALDWGLGAVAERSFGRWTLGGGLSAVFPGDPDDFDDAGESLENLYVVNGGVEYRWNDTTSLLLGLIWTSKMFDDVTLEEIDREIFDFGIGLSRDAGPGSRWTLSFHEDLVAATGPDFTLMFGWSWGR